MNSGLPGSAPIHLRTLSAGVTERLPFFDSDGAVAERCVEPGRWKIPGCVAKDQLPESLIAEPFFGRPHERCSYPLTAKLLGDAELVDFTARRPGLRDVAPGGIPPIPILVRGTCDDETSPLAVDFGHEKVGSP